MTGRGSSVASDAAWYACGNEIDHILSKRFGLIIALYISCQLFRVRKESFELGKRVSSKKSDFRVRKVSFE